MCDKSPLFPEVELLQACAKRDLKRFALRDLHIIDLYILYPYNSSFLYSLPL